MRPHGVRPVVARGAGRRRAARTPDGTSHPFVPSLPNSAGTASWMLLCAFGMFLSTLITGIAFGIGISIAVIAVRAQRCARPLRPQLRP